MDYVDRPNEQHIAVLRPAITKDHLAELFPNLALRVVRLDKKGKRWMWSF